MQGAVVYVSGAAEKMPQDVYEALTKVAETHGCLSRTDAMAYMKRLEINNRYVVEAWS